MSAADQSDWTQFERCALASGLLDIEQLDEARLMLRPAKAEESNRATAEELAEQLVEAGHLNVWQAKQLLLGRTKFTLGPYRIIDSLGQGGMGHVFKAQHDQGGPTVAVKVLPRHRSTPEAIANFRREIQAQASLDHPNLVRALDDGEDGHVHYLVTEYVPGADLRKLVRDRGPLSAEAAASIISQAAAALQYAHDQGLIHRDVKPGNVLVTPDGHAKLADLGLAGPVQGKDAEKDPRYGKIVGTADYLSPDHIKTPWDPTPAWDIYSLGCTLYYSVTGKVPFPRSTASQKARAHCDDRPLDPRRLNPGLDNAIVEVMAEMLSKDPKERTRSASEVIKRLAPWAGRSAEVPLEARPVSRSAAAVPPPVQIDPPGGIPLDPDAQSLEDTQTSFPDLAALVEGTAPSREPPPVPMATPPPVHVEVNSETRSSGASALAPVVFLVLLPVLLVGAVVAIYLALS